MQVGHVFQSVANFSFASYEKICKVVNSVACLLHKNLLKQKINELFISPLYFEMNLFGILGRKPLDLNTHQNIIFYFYSDRFVLINRIVNLRTKMAYSIRTVNKLISIYVNIKSSS